MARDGGDGGDWRKMAKTGVRVGVWVGLGLPVWHWWGVKDEALYTLQSQTGSPFLYVDHQVWRVETRSWHRKFTSTKTTDEAEAHKVAAAIVATSQAAYRGAAKGWSQEKAIECVNDILTAAGLPLVESERTWTDASTAYMSGLKGSLAERTREIYQARLDEFGAWLGRDVSAVLRSSTFNGVRMQEFYKALRASGKKPSTANAIMKTVGSVFRRAREEGWCERNPVALVHKEEEGPGKLKRGTFTPAEAWQILEAARSWPHYPEEWVTVILAGICTGARLMDCARMRTEYFVRESKGWALKFTPMKTQRHAIEVDVPVVEPLLSWLLKLAKKRKGFFCPHLAKKELSATFARIMRASGVAIEVEVNDIMGREQLTRTFHSWRHSLPSWLQAAGVDKETRKRLVGHTDDETHELYTHHERAGLEKALNKVFKGIRLN